MNIVEEACPGVSMRMRIARGPSKAYMYRRCEPERMRSLPSAFN